MSTPHADKSLAALKRLTLTANRAATALAAIHAGETVDLAWATSLRDDLANHAITAGTAFHYAARVSRERVGSKGRG